MTKTIGVGIIGLGTIGGGTAKVLVKMQNLISARTTPIALRRVCDKNVAMAKEKIAGIGLDPAIVSDQIEDVINDPSVDIVVELMGGVELAYQTHLAAIAKGKSVVTANKDLVATYGRELFEAAQKAGVDVFLRLA